MKITRFQDVPQFTKDGAWQCDFNFEFLIEFIEENERNFNLQLNPDFQRGHVWNEEQQIKWLEFFLRGGRTGRILYFNCPSWQGSVKEGEYNDFVCVDGLQRITAIQRFMHGEIPVFGSYISEFQDKMPITHGTIKVNINDLKTKKEVLQWYIDMNTGGTIHTKEEIDKVKNMIIRLDEDKHREDNIELDI